MTAARRLAPLLLMLTGLAALAALVLVPWVLQAQSQEVTQTADATGGNPPAKPTNLQASAEHDEVVLTWTASSDQTVTHYAILRRNRDTDATGVFHVIESNAGPGTSYTDASVSASNRYNYRVKSVSPTGVSQWSGYTQAETPAAPPPTSTATPTPTPTPTPEDLRPTGLTVSLVENKVTLSWVAPAEDADSVTGYEILRRRPMEGETALATLAADTESTATTYTDATANEAGVRYVYRVKALRGSEASLWSNFYAIDLPADYEAPQEDGPITATTPGAPTLSTLMIVTSGSIILSWSEPADDGGSPVTGYRIEYSEDSGDTWQTLVEDTATTETEYTHGGLEPETTLHYRVSAINEHGAGSPSDAVSATTLPAPEIALPQVSKDSNVFLEFNIDTSTVILTDQDMPVVLVKNTGQAVTGTSGGIGAAHPSQAQGFTTGAHASGYTLSSIGIRFRTIGDTTTAGAELTAKLYDATFDTTFDVDVPNSPLCTLTDPGTFSGSGVQTFEAPTTDPCPTLPPETLYFAVVERANNNTDAITADQTISAAEDSGAAAGWEVSGLAFTYDGTEWSEEAAALLIEVKGSVIVPPVLVKNTGQADSGGRGLATGTTSRNRGAQAFTTGANPAGYTLGSIGFSFDSITETSTAGAHLKMTLNADSSGDPGTALCTLTDPATFSGSGVQTFDALTTDSCPTLAAETTYFAVVQRVASTASATISVDITSSDNEDTGGATGWTIGDSGHEFMSGVWSADAAQNFRVAVRGYAINNPATGAPSISGVLEEDEVLTADTVGIADVDVLGAFSYQWLADGTAISGATSSTYTLTAAEVGDAISLTVTFTDGEGNSESLTSAATHNVVATGATRKLLWVGTLTPADVGLSYIGFVDTMSGSLSPTSFIDGSTTHAFETIEYKAGFGLAIVVRPGPGAEERVKWIIDAGGEFALFDAKHIDSTLGTPNVRSEWLSTFGNPGWSIGTEAVVYLLEDLNNRATGAPSISGVLQQDEVLTADTAGIADADGVGTLAYQWLADGTAISGATSSTYTLTAAEVRDAISLRVTFTDNEGYSELLTSAETHDVVATGATRKLLWVGTLTPADRGFGAIGVNTAGTDGSLSPSSFTYGSDTYAFDQIDFGPVPSTGLAITMSPIPGANEEEAWIVDTGREWLVSDDDISINKAGGQMFLLWPAVAEDVEWTVGEETVVYLLEVVNNPPAFTDTAPTTRSVDENTASAADIGAAVAASDPESDTLVYALTGTDASSFTIDTTSGQLKTSASLDFESKSSYSVDVTVHDGKNAVGVADTTVDATIAVTISVNNEDEAGTVTLPATFTGGTEATASVSDLDGTVSSPSWRWARGNTATGSFSNIGGATSASYTPVAADVGKYLRATVTYTDPQGSGKTASAVSSGAVEAGNAEPTFDDGATTTRTLPENSGAGVDVVGGAIAATDSDSGDTLTYSLSGTDAARFEIDSNGQIKVKTGSTHTFNFESSKKSYSVTVSVRDSKDSAGNADTVIDDTIAVTINLTNVNEAPTITNLLDRPNVPENSSGTILLMASDVDVPDTQTWSVESTDDGSKFQVAGFLGSLSFKDQPDFETPTDVGDTAMNNTYVVTVKLTDSGGLSDTLTFTVTVTNVNEAPVFTSPPATADFAENGTGTVVDFDATDVDASSTLTFSLNPDDDGGKFDIDSTTGALTFKNPPNFEMPTDVGDTAGDNTYAVTVKVTDAGGLSDTHTLIVTVTDVNEAPVITNTETSISKQENETFVIAVSATDVDASDTLTWSVETADDGGKFEINATTGVVTSLSFKNAPDFETPIDADMNNTYVVTMKVTDDGSPAMSDTHKYTVTVTNVNEPPKITTLEVTDTSFDVAENTATSVVIKTYEAEDPDANSVLTWDLHGDDAGDFTITKNADGHGELEFRNVPNFEMPVDDDTDNAYDVIVRVRDAGGLSTTIMVLVTVTDVNETPVVSGDNSPDFAEIEYDVLDADLTAANYIVATYSATDDDNSDNANLQTITWDVSGDDAAHFTIDSTTGELSFSIRPDFENAVDMGSNNTYEIVVEADDGQGESNSVGTFTVTVTVTNVDETPEITTDGTTHTAPSFMEIEYDAATAVLTIADYDGRDEEEQTITWSMAGTDAGDFTIDRMTGVLSFAQRPNFPNFEMPADNGTDNVYNVTVRARDTASNTRELEVIVTVTDVNERPDINEDTVSSYAEIQYDSTGTRPDVHTFTATDYDDMDTFAWSLLGTDAAYLEIDATTGVLTFTQDSGFGHGPLPNFEHPRDDDVGDGSSNTYSITVRATDDDASDQKFTDYAVVITVTNVNEQPEFTGTPETAITLDEHDANDNYVVMDQADYDAYDEEGGVTWSLTGTDRGDFAISADGVVTFAKMPNFEAPEDSGGNNVYEFNVVATDVQSGSSRRNVSVAVMVTVGDVEEAGTLAVDNLSPAAGETVTFRLTDPDGGIDTTNMTWVIQSLATGGSWARVSGVLTPASTTFPWVVDEDETGKAVRAMVTYTDRRGSGKTAVSQQTAEVTANPIVNAPPRFRGVSSWSVEEGPAGGAVGTPTSVTDRDNDTLTYGIQSGLDAALFEIDPSTGQVRLAQALDFETTSAPHVLFFYLTLHDGRDADGNTEADPTVDVTRSADIFVVDVEEDGVVTLSAVEPETATPLTATLEDGDGGVTGEIWQWARSENGRTGWTNISGAASSSYTPTVADEDFFLRATVTYTDRRGAGKSAEGITGRRVPSENRSPVFPSTETGQRTVPENTRAGRNIGEPVAAVDPEQNSLTYTLTGTDAAAFTVVASTGQLRTSEALDFEAKPSYSITVEVHDGRDGAGNTSTTIDDTQAVTITVENVEEPGTVTLTTPTGTIQARAEVTAALEDDDIPTGVTWQWSRSPNGRTDWVNIQGATLAAYTPTLEEDRGNYIRATASYTDDEGPNKTANAVSPRVGDPPPVNSAPVFPSSEDGRREVAENSAEGSAVGTTVAATDLNAGDSAVNDPLAYSLTGTDAASFTIDTATGQISLAEGVTLDYEGKRTHRVTVEVTDGRDQNGDDDMDAIDDRQNVTITVTNVNEAPVVSGDDAPSFQEDSTAAIATYTATDPERDTLTWSVSGNDFWISSRGQLYFRTPPSYEPAGQAPYEVTVTATDDDETASLSGSLNVTVTVTDAEEEGVVAITPARGWVDVQTQFSASLTDDDGGVTGTVWQWARSPNGRSSWTDITGETSINYTVAADDANQYLRATASYEDRRGSNKTAEAVLSSPVGDVKPTTNTAPEFTEDDDDTDTGRSTTRTVREGTAAGRNVGSRVRANDADQGDVLTYSLSGTDAGVFDIDSATGQILTKDVLEHDADGDNTYEVTVSVHDDYGPDYLSTDVGVDATIDVSITVTAAPVVVRPPPTTPPPADEEETTTTTTTGGSAGGGGGGGGGGGVVPLNRSPSFTEGATTSRSVAENAVVGEYFGAPLAATDPDGDRLTYTLGGADSRFFDVNPITGRLRVKVPLDYETNSSHSVVVRVADGRGAAAFIAVTVAVVNVGLEGMVGRYDTDDNGAIDRDEAIAAVVDYFAGVISKEEAIAVITVYFAS